MSRIDRTAGRFLAGFWRQEAGNVAVIVALSLTALMGFVALGVDGASLYRVRAQLQSVSDLAALSAMRDPDAAEARATGAVTGNGMNAQSVTAVEVGRYLRNPALPPSERFTPLEPGAEGINAVRVALARSEPLHFARAISDADSVTMAAQALAARTGAARFSLTSHVARLDGATLNDALSQGLGVSVSLTAGEAEALAGVRLSLGDVLDALGRQTGLAERNPAAILDATTTVGAVLTAAQGLLPAGVTLPARGALRAVPVAALVSGADPALGLTVSEALAETDIAALDLLRALALAGLGAHPVDVAVDVPGVLDVSGVAMLGPRHVSSGWMALGEAGVTLHRSAARLDTIVGLQPALLGSLGTGVTATRLSLPLVVELAGATATLDRIACDTPDPDSEVASFLTAPTALHPLNGTSVAALYLGTLAQGSGPIDPASLGFADVLTVDVTVPLLLTSVTVRGLVVQARSHVAVGASGVERISFDRSDVEAGRTTGHFGASGLLRTGVGGLLDPARTQLRLKPGQDGLLTGTVAAVLNTVLGLLPARLSQTLLTPVDAVLDALLTEAGLSVGEGELTLDARHCELVRLAQ